MSGSTTTDRPLAGCIQALIDHAPLGLLLADAAGRIVDGNARAWEACGASEPLIGANVAGLDLPLPGSETRDATRGKSTYLAAQHGPAAKPEVSCTCIPLGSGDGLPGGTLIILAPRNSGAAADHARLQLEKLATIDNLVAGVAHELNNPLTAILGYAELLLQKNTDAVLLRRLSGINDEARRCKKIVENLLRFADRYNRPKAAIDLGRLISETMELCSYQMQVDGIAIRVHADDKASCVEAEPMEVQRALLNLLHNAHRALRAAPPDNRVLTVSTTHTDTETQVRVTDTGPGIPVEIRHQIFDPFFTTQELGEGMGLGLTVAFGIMSDLGGRVWLDAAEPGGTSFVMAFPAPGQPGEPDR